MRRKIYEKLLEWKSRNGESALLIKGARRVGKSYIVEEFAKKEYKSYIKIDFNDIPEDTLNLIIDNLHDRDRLFSYLQLTYKISLFERESLIMFDEIQLCPKVRAAIKYLVADHRYDYIETGSLLSIAKNVKNIIVPSEEESIELEPMDFEEFLWAKGEDILSEHIKESYAKLKPLDPRIHRSAMKLFREYMVLGGMPQVVKKYVETNNFNLADREKTNIITLYRNDIAKHTGNYTLKVQNIFDSIPSELSKHEKKFRLADIDKNARMREYLEPFTWLQDARFVNICFASTDPNLGLAINEDRTSIKCYMADTGLLYTIAFNSVDEKNDVYTKIINNKLEINEGMFMENIVAQMLKAAGHKLYFYSKFSTDKDERMELDFLIPKNNITSRHNINFIEVKSGERYTLSSLTKASKKYSEQMNKAIVLHPDNIKEAEGIIYLPMYMTGLL